MQPAVDSYEQNQHHNLVTQWLHSHRFSNAIDVVGDFAADRSSPLKLVEIGCAHGRLFGFLDRLFPVDYTGIDLNAGFLETARVRYGTRPNFRVLQGSALDRLDDVDKPDVVVALETLEHIPAPVSFRIVEKIAALRPNLFLCSVPIEVGPSIVLKNTGSAALGYVRHRSYSWRETYWAGTYQLHKLPPHATGHKGFDWRWLAHTVRCHFRIREIRTLPFNFMPTLLSTSVFMVAEPR